MYFDNVTEKLFEGQEPFSLRALAVSKGRSCFKSEITPQSFDPGQEVKLNKIYPKIYDQLDTKLKYKKYFSAWIVIGASWNITEERWYYMIRLRRQVFVWVTEDQITKLSTTQTQISRGPQKEQFHRYSRQRHFPDSSDHTWQQSLEHWK